jgi:hypothetical protein
LRRRLALAAALSLSLASAAVAAQPAQPAPAPLPSPAPSPAPPPAVPAASEPPSPTGGEVEGQPEPERDPAATAEEDAPREAAKERATEVEGDGTGGPEVRDEDADKDKDKDKDKGKLRFGGRVFVRDTLTGIDAGMTTWQEHRTLESARAFLDYRPGNRLRMVLEADFRGNEARLKDVFIRYRPVPSVSLIAGQFKKPVSFIALESTWRLPRIERGLLAEVQMQQEDLPFVGGRGTGFAVEVAPDVPLAPQLTLAVHASPVVDDLNVPVTETIGQDVFARFEIAPLPELHLAVAGGWVDIRKNLGDDTSFAHRGFGTVEAWLEMEVVNVWLEAFAGQNLSAYLPDNRLIRGEFLATRGIVAPRLPDVAGLRAIEPYVAFAWYDLSSKATDDRMTELSAGVAVSISNHLRLQLEGSLRPAGDNAALPMSDTTLVRLQIGAAFDGKTELH